MTRGGITQAQWSKWEKEGRPESITYRGKKIDMRMFKQMYGTDRATHWGTIPDPSQPTSIPYKSPELIEREKKQLERQKKKLEKQEERNAEEVEELKAKAKELWKKDESSAQELGSVLLKIKQLVGHGQFSKWWNKAGFTQNRVSYCLSLVDKAGEPKAPPKPGIRTKVLSRLRKSLLKLWDAKEERDADKAVKLYESILVEISAWLDEAKKKPRAKAASA